MSKQNECPTCGKSIEKHKTNDALDCVNELGLVDREIDLDEVYLFGKEFAGLRSWGQRNLNKNIISLGFGRRNPVETEEPERMILQEVLFTEAKKNEKKEKKDAETTEDE